MSRYRATAKTRRNSSSGPSSFATLIALVAIVELLLRIPGVPGLARLPGVAFVVVGLALALVIAMVFDIRRTNAVVAVLGSGLLAETLGVSGTLTAVLLVGLLSWIVVGLRRWRG